MLNSRSNTSGTELSTVESARQLLEGITGTADEVQDGTGGDILASDILKLLQSGGDTVLVGAEA